MPTLAIATSHGGHLELLDVVRGAFADRRRVWLTPPSAQAEALARRGERVVELVDPRRSPARLAHNVAQAVARLRELRPGAVLSAGSGAALPFCLAARAAGVPLIFVETMARTQDASITGRVAHRFADHFLVQWGSLRPVYPRAEVCRPALLEGAAAAPARQGRGTLVTCGTHSQPFDRLLMLVDEAAGEGLLPAPVRVQGRVGAVRLRHVEPVPILPPEVVREAIETSEVVVTHGGSGVISLVLRSGRMPLVLPRLRAHREHHDDHQAAMVRHLDGLGLVAPLDRLSVPEALQRSRGGPGVEAIRRLEGPPLEERLREILDEVMG